MRVGGMIGFMPFRPNAVQVFLSVAPRGRAISAGALDHLSDAPHRADHHSHDGRRVVQHDKHHVQGARVPLLPARLPVLLQHRLLEVRRLLL